LAEIFMGINDKGETFTLSPDPRLEELTLW
jgi:hypothetical protein